MTTIDQTNRAQVRCLTDEELDAVTGGLTAADIASAADKLVKTAAIIGGAVAATAIYFSIPRCQ